MIKLHGRKISRVFKLKAAVYQSDSVHMAENLYTVVSVVPLKHRWCDSNLYPLSFVGGKSNPPF
jgi:hypothetical protein